MTPTEPSVAPGNLTFDLRDQELRLGWAGLAGAELRGRLLAYKLQWSLGGERQVGPQAAPAVGRCGDGVVTV